MVPTVSRMTKLTALLLVALWLPASLHCKLEAADVHFLTHDDHHHADTDQDHGNGTEDEHHAFMDAPYTAGATAVKILPPGDSLSVVLLALIASGREVVVSQLSPDRHPPPLELKSAWQFLARAAPPARAPSLNS